MKKIPLRITDFAKIRKQRYFYIDKTEYLHTLQKQGSYFIFLRPNRFGKSLFINTLQNWLERKKTLFEGLWIEEKTDWTKTHKVLSLDLESLDCNDLAVSLTSWLKKQAETFQISLSSEISLEDVGELIRKIAEKKPLAFLIDNYDQPVTRFLSDPQKIEENNEVLNRFYGAIYENYDHLAFFWLTGVAHLGQFSFWEHLGFCEDISFDPSYTTLAGFTTDELKIFAGQELKNLSEYHANHDVWALIEAHYKGFSWNGRDMLYNPFTMLNLFEYQQFRNYWYDPQIASSLAALLPNQNFPAYKLENMVWDLPQIDEAKLQPLEVIPFLFRLGYLTIQEKNIVNQIVVLDYPNRKIQESFYKDLLLAYTRTDEDDLTEWLFQCSHTLWQGEIPAFIETLNLFFQKINHTDFAKKEEYFYSVFYLIIKVLERDWEAQVLSTRRRIDALCQTENALYLMQFKIASVENIIGKLKEKNYLANQILPSTVYLLAISFDPEKVQIQTFSLEAYVLEAESAADLNKGASL